MWVAIRKSRCKFEVMLRPNLSHRLEKNSYTTMNVVKSAAEAVKSALATLFNGKHDIKKSALFGERRDALVHEHVAGPAELEVNAEFGAAHNLKPHFESVARLDLFEYALGGARRDLQVQSQKEST